MAIKTYRPTTPSRRHMTVSGFDGVDKHATKVEIKKAVEEIFDVTVLKVTTTTVHGKKKRTGRYPAGFQKTWKKAVVKLSADSKSIELFEGMA